MSQPLAQPLVEINMFDPNTLTVRVRDSLGYIAGATVEILVNIVTATSCTPTLLTRTTNSQGYVSLLSYEIFPTNPDWEMIKNFNFNFIAYVEGSRFGGMSETMNVNKGDVVTVTVKEYFKSPEFFLKYKLRDIIGVDIVSNMLSTLEQFALEHSGFTVTKVEGKGTADLTIYFKVETYSSLASPVSLLGLLPSLIIATATIVIGLYLLNVILGPYAPLIIETGLIALALLGGAVLVSSLKGKEIKISKEEK